MTKNNFDRILYQMIKYIRCCSVFFILCLPSATVLPQTRTNFMDDLSIRFSKYVSAYPWEDIYVHSDREDYIAGEKVWFGIYAVDRQTMKTAGTSSIAYIEVLNSDNRSVAGKRVRLNNGTGYGELALPDTISSGRYTLRAYTNWMKNFLPDNCFSKTLSVFNSISNSNFSGKENSGIKIPSENQSQKLYAGTGYVTEIDNSDPQVVSINIGTTKDLRNREGSLIYIFIETRGNINYTGRVDLIGNKTTLNLPATLFIPGINHITLFNSAGKPVDEEFMLTSRRRDGSLKINSPGTTGLRSPVSVSISGEDTTADISDSTELSISVVPVTGHKFQGIDSYMLFGSEFGVLPDELRNSDPAEMTGEDLKKALSSLNDKWINWENILSDDHPAIKYHKESDYHFVYGKLINQTSGAGEPGKYLFLSIPGKKATFQYAVTDRNGDFSFMIPVDDKIRDLILQPKETDNKDVIRSESPFSEKYPVRMIIRDSIQGILQENIGKMKINYQVAKIYKDNEVTVTAKVPVYASGSRRFYGKPDVELKMDDYIKLPVMQEVFFELIPGATLKSRKVGYEIVVTDPIEFKPFESPATLMVDGVIINDASIIANMDPELVERIEVVRERYFVGDYLFYGIVNVITRAGNFSNVTLPDYAVRLAYRITDPSESFNSPLYQDETKKQSRIPDFRNTLYWNPSVKFDSSGKANLEFWSSDFAADYEIIVQGLSRSGKPFYARSLLTVKK